MTSRGIRVGLTAIAAVAGLALSGCGILGNPLAGKADPSPSAAGPSASPSPSAPAMPTEPVVGECHIYNYTEQITLASDTVSCDTTHMTETVHVGRFVGEAAAGDPPKLIAGAKGAAAAAQNAAYLDCSANADKYLGHSWLHPLLDLQIAMPDDTSWQAGQRWYRCDITQVEWADGQMKLRTSSLKAAWLDPVCTDANQDRPPLLSCSARHSSEYVGGFLLPATLTKRPKSEKELKPYYEKCWKIIGSYAGVTTGKARSLTGAWLRWQYRDTYWASGRRVAWCYTWTGSKTSSYVTGSAKGRKGKGL